MHIPVLILKYYTVEIKNRATIIDPSLYNLFVVYLHIRMLILSESIC